MAFYAAKTSLDLRKVATRVQHSLAMLDFHYDVEAEGEDWWEYAVFDGPALINLTKIGHFARPALWRWMWGAPDTANFQLIIKNAGPDLGRIEAAAAEALGCALTPYPNDFRL